MASVLKFKARSKHADDQPPVRRFGKRPMRAILDMNDEDFLHYIRNGDDPELYRLDDLEESIQALADRMCSCKQDAAVPGPRQAHVQTQPRGLDVVAR